MDIDLVDLRSICPRIVLDIRYATADNFLGRPVYPAPKCFLREKVAKKLVRIQERLEKRGLGLKVFDGYRPLSVQKIFWEQLPDDRYVAHPAVGSKHNRAAAVDVTLLDASGSELPMPTPFDSFSERAHRTYCDLPQDVLHNRTLLERAMGEEGFIPLPTEWWHFDDAEWSSYPIEDISLDLLR
jgi:D-alanyl-D-alanine dipeptidase